MTMRRRATGIICVVIVALLGISPRWAMPAVPPVSAPVSGYSVVATYPHDAAAFTEGLFTGDNGTLYESTGLNGKSSLRRVDLASGQVRDQITLASQYFGEGATRFGGTIYQLTWQSGVAFAFGEACFCQQAAFQFEGEGWGLTHDAAHLIMSDGTSRLRVLDPQTFTVLWTLDVADGGVPVTKLNELEYVRGEIYANVWQTDRIARIDPATGAVTGWLDLAALVPDFAGRDPTDDVLNGIAYDADTDRLFVTGKRWPVLYEIVVQSGT